jgi:hypothetical protein
MSALAEPKGDRAVALIVDGIAALARTGGAR